MTPEELNRTIEFIVESQARLAAAQEQDRQDRVHFDRQFAKLMQTQTDLIALQSRRIDECQQQFRAFEQQFLEIMDDLRASREEFRIENQEARKEAQRHHQEAQKWHEQTVEWLQRILERITDRLN